MKTASGPTSAASSFKPGIEGQVEIAALGAPDDLETLRIRKMCRYFCPAIETLLYGQSSSSFLESGSQALYLNASFLLFSAALSRQSLPIPCINPLLKSFAALVQFLD